MYVSWLIFCFLLVAAAFTKIGSIFTVFLLIPAFLTLCYYIFKNEQSDQNTVNAFFSDFTVGGHRGSHYEVPENSFAAFEACKREGCQLVEFDIEITKDQVLIIMHDDTVDRTTDRKGRVQDFTITEIQGMKLKFVPKSSGVTTIKGKVPTLHETVIWCKENGMKMLFDIKNFNDVVITTIICLFEKYDLFESAICSGFNPLTSYFLKRRNPRILTGYTFRHWCFSTESENTMTPNSSCFFNFFMQLFDECNHQFASFLVIPRFLGAEMLLTNHKDVCHTLVDYAAHNNIRVVAWTVNNAAEAKWMTETLKIPFLTDNPASVNLVTRPISSKSSISKLSTSSRKSVMTKK